MSEFDEVNEVEESLVAVSCNEWLTAVDGSGRVIFSVSTGEFRVNPAWEAGESEFRVVRDWCWQAGGVAGAGTEQELFESAQRFMVANPDAVVDGVLLPEFSVFVNA